MLHGRDVEVAALERLVAGARAGRGGAVVVRGGPGIGKSALLAEARAAASDLLVLSARGVEAEADLPFAGLHQLLRPVWREVVTDDDGPAGVLAQAFTTGVATSQERFVAYAACLNVLSDLAATRPVVGLVDDAQWLDSSSAEALLFVARRLECEPIALVFAARVGEARRFDAPGLPALDPAPLAPDVAAALLRRRADVSAGAVAQLVALARGNPLALLELPRSLTDGQLTGTEAFPEQIALTAQLEEAYATRLDRLPAACRAVLVVAAADGSEDVRVVSRAALLLGLEPQELDAAEEAGLLRVRSGNLEFTHPLVRAAVLGRAPSTAVRSAHRALAAVLQGADHDADRRAWHLAAGALGPDDEVVAELDRTAEAARRRGGLVAAAGALERAAELCADPEGRSNRLVRAAQLLSLVGRDEQAVTLVERADPGQLPPRARAAAAYIVAGASIRARGRPADAGPAVLAVARDLAPEYPSLAAGLLPVATFAGWQAGDRAVPREAGRIAASLEGTSTTAVDLHLVGSVVGFAALLDGDRETARVKLRATIEWGQRATEAPQVMWAAWAALWLGQDEAFERLVGRAVEQARRSGEIGALADALGMQSVHLALVAQRYDDAAVAADESVRLAADLGIASLTLLPLAALAIVAAVRGDGEAARSHAGEIVRLGGRDHPFRVSPVRYALALLATAEGRWSDALDELALIADPLDPALAIAAPELVEAAVRCGQLDRAAAALEVAEQRSVLAGTPDPSPRLAACRALLGHGPEAERALGAATARAGSARPFDRPRLQLLQGERLRRDGRRLDAREPLRAALAGFEDIGARVWAERARQELLLTGETARRRSPDAVTQLTPQERQIARLVAAGLTNKEVATQLFLSPRTVDAHLRGVFAKLGITSRRELRSLPALASDAPGPTVGG